MAHRNDGGADVPSCVDDLFDARNTQCDIHGSHSGEMERFQCHLRARFPDALSAEGTDR